MNDENGTVSGLFEGTQGAIKAEEEKLKCKERVTEKAEIPDLYETVDMMCSDEFEDRIRAEYWQLRIRRMKLERQRDKLDNKVERLDEIDEAQKGVAIELMTHQLLEMRCYAEILIKRATLCGIDLCAGDAEGIAERCIMAEKHRQEAHDLKGVAVQKW